MVKEWLAGLAILMALGSAQAAGAQELRIAVAAEATSIDPLFHNVNPNIAVAFSIFDELVEQDAQQHLIPGLATSWKPIDDHTWEFELRHGVRFSDGTKLTPEDVVFSIERAALVPNSPSPFTMYTKAITGFDIIGPHTIRFTTKGPYPLLPNDLSNIAIQSKQAAQGKTTADFNDGKAAIGTGPFKFVQWIPGNRLVLARNDLYWGRKPEWKTVVERPITAPESRVAALLAGDVDMIEDVPPADIANLKARPGIVLSRCVSNRVIYLHLDTHRDQSPDLFSIDGEKLDKNPLKDLRVRQAISMAINRKAIVERVMEGSAVAAGQLLPEGFFGVSPKLAVQRYDPAGAKALLAAAGYPHGFRITLHGPNNRYINDEKVAEAVAAMLTRVGIVTKVDTMPSSVFFSNASKLDYSFILAGWGSGTGEASSPLKALLATYDPAKGRGTANRGRYSNPKLDAALDQALHTVDDQKRDKLLQQATEIGIDDLGIIPLHYEVSTWGLRKGLAYVADANQLTLPAFVTRTSVTAAKTP